MKSNPTGIKMQLNLENISQYIINNYQNSSLAYNIRNYEYSQEELLIECSEFFTYELIGLCGCGDPEPVEQKIKILLNIFDELHKGNDFNLRYEAMENDLMINFGVKSIYDNELLLFMVYILNNKNILEHGSSVSGSWLSEIGKMYLYVLNNRKFETSDVT